MSNILKDNFTKVTPVTNEIETSKTPNIITQIQSPIIVKQEISRWKKIKAILIPIQAQQQMYICEGCQALIGVVVKQNFIWHWITSKSTSIQCNSIMQWLKKQQKCWSDIHNSKIPKIPSSIYKNNPQKNNIYIDEYQDTSVPSEFLNNTIDINDKSLSVSPYILREGIDINDTITTNDPIKDTILSHNEYIHHMKTSTLPSSYRWRYPPPSTPISGVFKSRSSMGSNRNLTRLFQD